MQPNLGDVAKVAKLTERIFKLKTKQFRLKIRHEEVMEEMKKLGYDVTEGPDTMGIEKFGELTSEKMKGMTNEARSRFFELQLIGLDIEAEMTAYQLEIKDAGDELIKMLQKLRGEQ